MAATSSPPATASAPTTGAFVALATPPVRADVVPLLVDWASAVVSVDAVASVVVLVPLNTVVLGAAVVVVEPVVWPLFVVVADVTAE